MHISPYSPLGSSSVVPSLTTFRENPGRGRPQLPVRSSYLSVRDTAASTSVLPYPTRMNVFEP